MSYLTQQFNNQAIQAKYPWLSEMVDHALDCNPDNFWCFLEFDPSLDFELNQKFLKDEERYQGYRLMKVKILETNPNFKQSEKKHYRYCQVSPDDVFTLELSPKEIDDGVRYLKIHQPHRFLRHGWLTPTEEQNGWKVVRPSRVQKKSTRRRKVKKTEDVEETQESTVEIK